MKLLYLIAALRTPQLDTVMDAVTRLGSTGVFIVLTLFVFWCVDRRCGLLLLMAGLLGTLVGQVLKPLLHVPRPWQRDPGFPVVASALADAGGYSMPSGHSINAAVTSLGLCSGTRRRMLQGLWLLLGLAVVFSRLYLGVHTPADVLLGILVGGAAVALCSGLLRAHGDGAGVQRLMLLALTLLCFGALLLVQRLAPAGAAQYADAVENLYLLSGASAGLLLASLPRGGIDFSEHAPFWGQLLKFVLGLVMLAVIVWAIGLAAERVGTADGATNVLRAAGAVWFAAGVWPRWFVRFLRK